MPDKTANKYSRIARLYDLIEWPVEALLFKRLRAEAVSHIAGDALEPGVGTGKNLPYYTPTQSLTAIDFSPGMLRRAQQRLMKLPRKNIELIHMDVQAMSFEDNHFDSSLSSFLFCTVPQPMLGLKELYRVLKPGGRAIFLEHQRSHSGFINLFLYMMEPLMRLLLGTSMIRDTQNNIAAAGFIIDQVEFKGLDVLRLIITHKPE